MKKFFIFQKCPKQNNNNKKAQKLHNNCSQECITRGHRHTTSQTTKHTQTSVNTFFKKKIYYLKRLTKKRKRKKKHNFNLTFFFATTSTHATHGRNTKATGGHLGGTRRSAKKEEVNIISLFTPKRIR